MLISFFGEVSVAVGVDDLLMMLLFSVSAMLLALSIIVITAL
jgi:hypothetical protein